MTEEITCNYEGIKKVLKWVLDEFKDNHNIVTLDNLYEKYGFGTGQTLFWLMTVKHSWVFRGIDKTIIPKVSFEQITQIYEDSKDSDRPSIYFTIKSDKETTQFTCGSCGEKWNLVSPKSDTDTCPECGVTVYSDTKRIQP